MNKSRTTLSVQVEPEFKRRLETLAHEYRMNFSLMIREMLELSADKWEQALTEASQEH